MTLLSILLCAALAIIIAKNMLFSFRNQSPENYVDTGPAFDLKTHLNGVILSEGLIFGPTGKMTNSFVARMVGEWNGNSGTLSEYFTYSNGRQQKRKWYLQIENDTHFSATADDIIGTAQGTISGSTIKMTYTIVLPEEAGGHSLNVTDWLYLAENGSIMNKSEMRKFGIKVAELVATMRPDPAVAANAHPEHSSRSKQSAA